MAWFLGIIGFFFMLSSLLAPDWLTIQGQAPSIEGGLIVPGSGSPDVSWGLYEVCLLPKGADEWACSSNVTGILESTTIDNEDIFGWLAHVGNLITVGEVVLFVALVVVFVGLCCPFSFRFRLFRLGMYLYLFTDLLFMIALIVFPAKLRDRDLQEQESNAIGWCYGMGWGVVIIVFTGAILLLLDKDTSDKGDPVKTVEEVA